MWACYHLCPWNHMEDHILCFHVPLAHVWSKNYHRNSCRKWMKLNLICFLGRAPDFKWQGWSNGGKNQNPKKSLHQNLTSQKSETEFPNHKNFPESIKWYNTKIGPFSFEHPKKSLLKIKLVPQKILAKIFLPKSIPNWKFQTQRNLSSVAVTWNPEYPPPRICLQDKKN